MISSNYNSSWIFIILSKELVDVEKTTKSEISL